MPQAVDEIMIVAMARALKGEVLVSSVTPMGALAGWVAKCTHAPELCLLSTPESGMDVTPMPTLTLGQFVTDRQMGIMLSMEDIFDAIFRDRFRIWISPAQVDRLGNANISAIGPWERPHVALVGSRGIPEDSSHLSQLLYYVTSHTPRTLVPQVDFRSGAGYGPERSQWLGNRGRPTTLVTDLGVFAWNEDGSFVVESLHPGVDPETVRRQTGFPVNIPEDVPRTPEPTPEERALIRSADPLCVRQVEFLAGRKAAEKWQEVFAQERQVLASRWPFYGRRQ